MCTKNEKNGLWQISPSVSYERQNKWHFYEKIINNTLSVGDKINIKNE